MQALRFGEKCASVQNVTQGGIPGLEALILTLTLTLTLIGGISGLAALIAALDREIASTEKAIVTENSLTSTLTLSVTGRLLRLKRGGKEYNTRSLSMNSATVEVLRLRV